MSGRPQWRDHQRAGVAAVVMVMVGWVKRQTNGWGVGGEEGEAASTCEHSELVWVSTTQPCTLPDSMEMQCGCNLWGDALTSAWKQSRLICYKRGGGFIEGSYTLPTYYFALQQSWKRSKRQRGVDRGVKKRDRHQLQGDRRKMSAQGKWHWQNHWNILFA